MSDATKNDLTNFQIFSKISLAVMVDIVDLALKAVIDILKFKLQIL